MPYLDDIVAAHRLAAASDRRDLTRLEADADRCPPTRGFRRRLVEAEGLAVIAEIKRRSPSKGDLAPDLDAASLAVAYASGGAAALSVLTDEHFFAGSATDLATARAATMLPVLRKDFTVSAADVLDARIMGADCVLLIVAALAQPELVDFLRVARAVGLDALVEVRDVAELGRAVDAGADLVGVNQRDLATFEVDRGLAAGLVADMPADVVRVAESGIRGADDAAALASAGYHAVLVGEHLVTSTDPAAEVAALRVGT